MGCDIHFYVEKKVENEWVSADNWCIDEDDGSLSLYEWGPGLSILNGPMYRNRNYDLFSILADVRNGSGFAGLDTGEGFVPIHEPRGIPEDASENVRLSSEQWDADGHSHSWATVEELMTYDWTRKTKKRGWVSPKQFALWHLEGKPKSWSGLISGGQVEHISNEDMMKHIVTSAKGDVFKWSDYSTMEERPLEQTLYTQVEWEVSYFEQASDFLSHTMPQLWKLGKPSEVRCVYWFDN